MATPMNFQTLNFGNIPQQESEARRRYYDSLGSIGGTVSATGTKVDEYLQRKQREAEDKKKWDNMIAQQEYQKKYQADRDAIADKRYDDELGRKLEKEKMENEALANAKKSLDGMPSPEHIGVMYGPGARSALVAMQNAPTYADFMNAQKDLNQSVYQKRMLREQRRMYENENKPKQVVKTVMSNLSKGGVDIRGGYIPTTLDEKGTSYVPDRNAIAQQIALIDRERERLNIDQEDDYVSSTRMDLLRKRAALEQALNPAEKPVYTPSWNGLGGYVPGKR